MKDRSTWFRNKEAEQRLHHRVAGRRARDRAQLNKSLHTISARLQACQILVVDDEAAVRETLADMLEACSRMSCWRTSGQERGEIGGDISICFYRSGDAGNGWVGNCSRDPQAFDQTSNRAGDRLWSRTTVPPDGEAETRSTRIIGKPFDFVQVRGQLPKFVG